MKQNLSSFFVIVMHSNQLYSAISVAYRFLIVFGLGYFSTSMLTTLLTLGFYHFLGKAEAVFLAAFLALIFYVGLVILSFCISSLKKLSLISFSLGFIFLVLLRSVS